MRTGQPDVGAGDRRHADEVVCAGKERGERRRERLVPAHAHADRGRDQLLLGDEDLEEAVRVRLGELVGVRRVGHLAVHGDDFRDRRERKQGIAVCLARGDLVFFLVGRQHRLRRRHTLRRCGPLRLLRLDLQVADAAQLLDGALGHIRRQGLAVPAVLVLDFGETLALDRPGDDHGRLFGVRQRLAVRPVDGAEVVAVDDDRVAAERLHAAAVGVEVPTELRLAALAEAVDVPDGGQVGRLVVRRLVECLPDRSLGELGVAAQDPHVERQLVEVLARDRHTDADGQALAERAGGDVDPRDRRGRVALQARAELAVSHELLVADRADGLEHRVAERRSVTLGVDEVVVVRVLGLAPVVLQVLGDQDGDQVCGRHRGRGVAGSGGRAAPDRVDAQLLTEVADEFDVGRCDCLFGDGHVAPLRTHRCELTAVGESI